MEKSVWDLTHFRIRDLAPFGDEGAADPVGVLVGGPENKNWYLAIDSFEESIDTFVMIGGRKYKTVVIGNQEWMAEPLDYKFDGLTFRDNADTNAFSIEQIPQAAYYNYDENKGTLLYNGYASVYITQNLRNLDIPEGWHVPSTPEFNQLTEYVGGWRIAGKKLKSTSFIGTDDYGFCMKTTSGWRFNQFIPENQYRGHFWTTTPCRYNYPTHEFTYFYLMDSVTTDCHVSDSEAYSIRLVRNLDSSEPSPKPKKYFGKRIGIEHLVILGPQGKIPAVNLPSCISECSYVEIVETLPVHGNMECVYCVRQENRPDKFYRWVEDAAARPPSPKTGSFVSIACNYTMEPGKGTLISDHQASAQDDPLRGTVTIGEHEYSTTTIGNLEWLAENLYEPLPDFGSLTDGANHDSVWANFPTLNDNSQGYGILYYLDGAVRDANGCRSYLDRVIPQGWRIPTMEDINALMATVDGWEDLASADEGGNDKYGFAAKCAGVSARDWNYVNAQGYPDGESNIMIDDTSYNMLTIYHPTNTSRRMTPFFRNWPYRIPIRLVRDAVPPAPDYTRQIDLNITSPGSPVENVLSCTFADGIFHGKSGIGDSGGTFPSSRMTTGTTFGDEVYEPEFTVNGTGHISALNENAVKFPDADAQAIHPGLVVIATPDSDPESPSRSHILPISGADNPSPGTINPPAGEYVYVAPADHVHSAATLTLSNLRNASGAVDVEYNMAANVTLDMLDVLHALPPSNAPSANMMLQAGNSNATSWTSSPTTNRHYISTGHSFVVVGTNTSLITNGQFKVLENTLYHVNACIRVKITEGLGLNSPGNVPKCYVCVIDIGGVTRSFNIPGSYTFTLPYTVNVDVLYKSGSSSASDHMVNVDVKATLDDNIFSACCELAEASELI